MKFSHPPNGSYRLSSPRTIDIDLSKDDPLLFNIPWTGQIPQPTQEEMDFPLAYSILAYREPLQVLVLLRAIYRPQNIYCIHVDGNAPSSVQEAFQRFFHSNPLLPNVFMIEQPVSVQHSTFTTLQADLLCMKDLLREDRQEEAWKALSNTNQRTKKKWKYFINLTGQEYPRRTNLELVRILRDAARGSNIMHKTPLQLNRVFKRIWSPPPHDMILWKGWVHILACRGFVQFVIHDPRAHDLAEYLKDTEVPDESFFSTLNHNAHLMAPGGYGGIVVSSEDHYPYINRFKVWSNAPDHLSNFHCRGVYVRLICIFGDENFPDLVSEDDPTLFINKFILELNGNLFQRIDKWFLNRQKLVYAEPEIRINITYYMKHFIQAPRSSQER